MEQDSPRKVERWNSNQKEKSADGVVTREKGGQMEQNHKEKRKDGTNRNQRENGNNGASTGEK
jgi:hypothetical protein